MIPADKARDNGVGLVRGTIYGLAYSSIAWGLLALAWWLGQR